MISIINIIINNTYDVCTSDAFFITVVSTIIGVATYFIVPALRKPVSDYIYKDRNEMLLIIMSDVQETWANKYECRLDNTRETDIFDIINIVNNIDITDERLRFMITPIVLAIVYVICINIYNKIHNGN